MARSFTLLAAAALIYLAARQRALTERETIRVAMLAGRAQAHAQKSHDLPGARRADSREIVPAAPAE